MKKKTLIELFIYIIIAIVGTIMLFTYKLKIKEIKMPVENTQAVDKELMTKSQEAIKNIGI